MHHSAGTNLVSVREFFGAKPGKSHEEKIVTATIVTNYAVIISLFHVPVACVTDTTYCGLLVNLLVNFRLRHRMLNVPATTTTKTNKKHGWVGRKKMRKIILFVTT